MECHFQQRQSQVQEPEWKKLWAKVFQKHYVKEKGAKLRFYGKDGSRLLFRAVQNDRDEDGTRSKYKASIVENGFNEEGRSKVVVIEREGGRRFEILAAAHCIEAVYELCDEGCRAEQLLATVAEGITDAIILHEQTPEDCQTWVVDFFNKYNVGSGFSLQQAMNRRAKLEVGWDDYKKDHSITVGTIGGPGALEVARRAWVNDTSGCATFAGHYEYFDALGRFMNQVKLTNREERFKSVLKTSCGNLTPTVDVETICRTLVVVVSWKLIGFETVGVSHIYAFAEGFPTKYV